MKTKITQRDIPTLEDGTYCIGNGLYFRKREGSATYFLRIQIDGRRRDISVGPAKQLTLPVAKAAAEKLRSQIKAGEYSWRKECKQIPTFGEFYVEALDSIATARQWTAHTVASRKRLMELHVLQAFRRAPINDITRQDVLDLVGDIWFERPHLGDRIRYTLEAILSIAVARGLRNDNPAVWKNNVSLFLPTRNKVRRPVHHKALSFQDTARVLARLIDKDDYASAKALIIAILTARRTNEVRHVSWAEIDFDCAIWTVPDEFMKIKRGHERRVPIPTQLVKLFAKWFEGRRGPYVCTPSTFAGLRGGRKATNCLSETALLYCLKPTCAELGIEAATVHGFRSTFTDWCAEHGEPVELVELSLDHTSGNEVRQAYFRTDLLEQRRGLLQRYADALFDEIEKAENGGVASSDTTPNKEGLKED